MLVLQILSYMYIALSYILRDKQAVAVQLQQSCGRWCALKWEASSVWLHHGTVKSHVGLPILGGTCFVFCAVEMLLFLFSFFHLRVSEDQPCCFNTCVHNKIYKSSALHMCISLDLLRNPCPSTDVYIQLLFLLLLDSDISNCTLLYRLY